MKTSSFLRQRSRQGFAMLTLLASMVIMLIVFAGVMNWVLTNDKQMRKNLTFTGSEAAAEGATEMVYASMDRDFLYGSLNSASNYTSLTPVTTNWPVRYLFGMTVTEGNTSSTEQPLGSQYQNLQGFPQTNVVTATATPVGQLYNVPATVSQSFVFASVPAFQFAIFYNINLEVDPGSSMTIAGSVFSNGGIWSGTGNVTYSYDVEAVNQVSLATADPFCSGKTDSGTPQANFTLAGMPVSNVNPLVIPIGANSTTNNSATNVQAILNIPPAAACAPLAAAYSTANMVYDFNAASLIVSNTSIGTNQTISHGNSFTAYAQDSALSVNYMKSNGVALHWWQLTNDLYYFTNRNGGSVQLLATNWIPNFNFTNVINSQWVGSPTGTNTVFFASFSFLTNVAFYDYRESATVQAVQIDVAKLNTWITNTAINCGTNYNIPFIGDMNHGINSIYVYNGVPLIGQKQLPAVRVVNGQQLPTAGLSVATPQPIYVKGNYNVQIVGGSPVLGSHNVASTYPAAFLADSITVLSTNWQDSWTSSTGLSSRGPTSTTINAGCLEGIVPSSNGNYSGGVENFLRLLENWSGTTLTYNGSIMVMFSSRYATNMWPGTGSVYNVPTRNWAFDTNFNYQTLLPPLCPQFRTVVRNQWVDY